MMKYNDILLSQYRENERKSAENAKRKAEEDRIRAKIAAENDIAPTYFQTGALSDGYKFGDVLRSVHGTVDDIYESTWAGILGMGEQVVDAGAYLLGGAGSLFGADEFADSIKEFIAGDLYDERKVANVINYILHPDSILANSDNSFFGDKTDSLLQSAGQLAGTAGLQALGVPWWLTTGITSFGGEVDNAFDQGASYGEAGGSALISAGAEVILEKLSGGIKFGGKTLDDILLKPLVDKIGNKVGRTLINFGIDIFGEGGEELLSSVFSRLGSNLYKREDILKLLTSEEAMDEYLESFIGGMVISGGMNAGKVASSLKSGRDYNTGLTDNEQKVFDKVYENRVTEAEKNGKLTSKEKNKIYDEVMEDLKEGGIDIDTIEEVLGGDTYKNYKNTVDSEDALKKELDSLRQMKKSDMNDIQSERLEELKAMNLSDTSKRDSLKSQLGKEVYDLAKDGYLSESYNERARRNEKFTADLTKYKGKQAEIVQKAIDSGFLNNTRKTHALVDLIAKVGGDKDIGFDFTNNEKLKNSGFAVEGRIINGYVTKDGVTVNINSKKALNSVVGHEITHVLEGTELYNELRNAVYEYSKTKGDYDGRRANIEKLYEGIKDADVDAELTADLIGDYLFTDTDFVRSLSTKNRNLFEKLFDEIKYLCKVATAGSKEARQLEAVKKAFQEAYRESGKSTRDDTNSLKQVESGENATEQPTEVNLSEKLSPEDAQAMNIMASNIVKAAKATGLSLDDYYKATENINAFNPTRADANAIADALEEYVEVMDKDVYRGYLEKIREFGGGVKYSLSSMANTFFDDPNMSAYEFQQADYKQTQGYEDYVEQCVNNYRQTRADFDEVATRKEIEDSIDGIVKVAIAAKKAGYDIYDDPGKRDKRDSKKRLLFSSLEPNSEYTTSNDISTICDKRQNFADIYDDIVRREEAMGVPKGKRFFDNVDNYFAIHKIMADKGLTQPCRQCYVESMRKNLAPMANAFLRLVQETNPNNTANDQLYHQKGKQKGEMKTSNASTRELVINALELHPEYGMTVNDLTVETLTTADGLAQLKIQAPLIYEAFNSFYGQSKPKMPKAATPFRFGELTALLTDEKGKIKQSLVDKINATGGFRLQSYSDFQIQNYTDVLQVLFEAGTLGLKGHAYTKVPAFLEATEGTNLKRNISIFMYKDGNEWKIDRNDSFPYSLEEIYDIVNADESGNTSIIAVSQNAEMSAWIMANDNVGYGIPFHKSGMKMGTVRDTIVKEDGREIKGYSGIKDHTKQQTEVWAKTTADHKAETKVKKGINIYEFWDFENKDNLSKNELIEKNVKRYINECEIRGYLPKFREYVMNNDKVLKDTLRYAKELGFASPDATIDDISFTYKGYRIPYGYYKFLGDFGMFTPDGQVSTPKVLSLENYDFDKAVKFFEDAESLHRNEILQQFSNGKVRQEYREGNLSAEQLDKIVKQKRGEVVDEVINRKNSLSFEDEAPTRIRGGIYGEDVLLEAPVAENIAPVRENIAPEQYEAIRPPKQNAQPRMQRVQSNSQVAQNNSQSAQSNPQNNAPKVAQIHASEAAETRKKQSGLQWFRRNFVDKFSVFEDLSLETGNRELMGKANFMLSSEQRAQRLIGNGNKAKGVKSLNDIKAEVVNDKHSGAFVDYMYHKHNVDRMSIEDKAQATISKLQPKFGHLRTDQLWAIALRKITNKTTTKTAQSIKEAQQYLAALEAKNKPVFGDTVTAQESQKVVNQYEAKYPQFKNFANDVYTYNNHLRGLMVENGIISQETADMWTEMYPHYVPIRRDGHNGAAINVPLDTNKTGVNAPIKRATGGNSDILDLFDTMGTRTEQTFKAIAKNNFGIELKNTLGTTIQSTNTSTNVDDVDNDVENHDDLLKPGKNGGNPTFTVFENGERVEFEITNEMYRALKPTSEDLHYTNKVLNKASSFHRGILTEYNPIFAAKNIIKDAQDVLINSQHPAQTYKNFPKALNELRTKGKWFTEYMENGGEQNTYFDGQSKTFTKEDEGIKKIIGIPLRKISEVNNFIERLPRLAEYIASRESGASVEVAMLDAARVTTNFQAGGDATKWAHRNGFTFLNASVQGAAQQVRNIREAKANGLKGWMQLAAKTIAVGLPAVLLNQLMWDDDEEYEELSDYVKDNYYIVAKYGDGQFVRIPKGRTAAVIQDAFEQMGNMITGNDEVDLGNFLELAISNLAPNNPLDNNVIAPIVQAHTNKTWYGDDLVPTRLQDLPNAEQYDESTDSISKWLGEHTGLSPYRLNYLLNQYSGGIGDVFLPMLTPEAEGGDNSLIGKFVAPIKDAFTTDSTIKNQNVSDFYTKVDELTTNAKSSKATDEDILKYKYMNSINSELSELYKQKREVQNSKLSDKQKFETVRELQKQINDLCKEGLESYKNVIIDGKYATVADMHFRYTDDGKWSRIDDEQLEKQKTETARLGITPADYWRNYTLSNVVGENYKTYSSEIKNITSDKNANGDTVKDSRKKKVVAYINGLNVDYGEKLLIYKTEYPADDSYNYEIVDYLNSRDDLTTNDIRAILGRLGFEIDDEGNISWD